MTTRAGRKACSAIAAESLTATRPCSEYGNKVRFGFGAVSPAVNARKLQWTSSGDVLTPGTWNHVAVTYDQDTHTVPSMSMASRANRTARHSPPTGLVANPTPKLTSAALGT